MTTSLTFTDDLLYPESDGQPMSESTEQYRWIVMVKENLEILFADRPDVFIAADLLWYPIQAEVPPAPCQAPDVMVALGRPKGQRRSYLQWQEAQVSPQVVFEILSASNKTRKGMEAMDFKFQFYQRYGVEEYYIYDPHEYTLEGWQRQGTELALYGPDRRRFLSSVELSQWAEQAEIAAERARLQAQQAQSRAEQAEQTLQASVPRLLALGLTVDQVAAALGLPIGAVQSIVDAQH
jgi:Uma2 family endonuclease